MCFIIAAETGWELVRLWDYPHVMVDCKPILFTWVQNTPTNLRFLCKTFFKSVFFSFKVNLIFFFQISIWNLTDGLWSWLNSLCTDPFRITNDVLSLYSQIGLINQTNLFSNKLLLLFFPQKTSSSISCLPSHQLFSFCLIDCCNRCRKTL